MVKGPFSVILKYIGLSTDTKPTDVPPGTRFYETDTGLIYVYTGTVWTLQS